MDPSYNYFGNRNTSPNQPKTPASQPSANSMPNFGQPGVSPAVPTQPIIPSSMPVTPTRPIISSSQPTMSSQPTAVNTGDIILTPSQPKKSKKIVPAIIMATITLLIGGATIWFFSSRVNAKNSIIELHESLGYLYDDVPQCGDLLSYADNISVSVKEYDQFTSNCIDSTAKINGLISNTQLLFGASEYNALRKEFVDQYNLAFLTGEQLSNAAKIYQTWHKWRVASQNELLTSNSHDLENTAKILTESGNETLSEFGQEWFIARKSLLDKQSIQGLQKYTILDQLEYEGFIQSLAPDLEELTGLMDREDYSDLANALTNLYNYAEANL